MMMHGLANFKFRVKITCSDLAGMNRALKTYSRWVELNLFVI